MTATAFSLELTAMVSQLSNPLNSENASPPGTFTVYLSFDAGVGASAAKASEAARAAMPVSKTRDFEMLCMVISVE